MKVAASAAQYYQDEKKEDYYLNGVGKEGRWFGSGANHFGLGATVTRDEFRNLLNGLSPNGKCALVQNAEKPGRDCCWDFTFNAPKSVSVFWAIAPKEVRGEIERAHLRAVQTALLRAEEVGGISRRGPGGKLKEKAKLTWAMFQEGTSRAQDPHLHTHAVLINVGVRPDRSTGSLHTPVLFEWKMGLGAIYQAELAAGLSQDLGLTIVPDKVAFRIEGVPPELCRAFSRRRAKIEKTMEELGFVGAVAAKTVAKDTRPKKNVEPPRELFALWYEVAERHGWGREQAASLARHESLRSNSRQESTRAVGEEIRAVPVDREHRAPFVREAARDAIKAGADGRALFESLSSLRIPSGDLVFRQSKEPIRATPKPQHDETPEREHRFGTHAPPESPAKDASTTRTIPGTHTRAAPSTSIEPPLFQPPSEPRSTAQALRPGDATENASRKGRRVEKTKKGKDERGRAKKPFWQGWKFRKFSPEDQLNHHAIRPPRKAFIRVEWQPVFPKAPWWSPARKLKAPVVAIGHRDPKWWKIRWKKDLWIAELRIQERLLFRNAPSWTGLDRATLPALRLTRKKSKFENKIRRWELARSKSSSTTKSTSKDRGHSH